MRSAVQFLPASIRSRPTSPFSIVRPLEAVIKMSWDAYIDNLIAQSKGADGSANVDKACIIGLSGGAPWTTAGHANALKVSLEERFMVRE